jgi:cytochrome oxidase Cu insertion factor (SCO1/SenC/PrrC family)/peroxiredoxin
MPPGKRRATALLTGCVLAGGLAAVLFAGVGTSSSGHAGASDGTVTQTAPGIDQAAADLMQLNVVPATQARRAPAIDLVDQNNQATTLGQYRGKVVIWSINDDKCTDLCALFAESVVAAEKDLGRAASDVVFLSINANPYYTAPSDVQAWSERNDLAGRPNWVYLTGSPAQLQRVWSDYQVTVIPDPKTRTVTHDAMVQFIDPTGRIRSYGYFGQGAISTAFYAHTMAQMADDLLPPSEQVQVGGPDVLDRATAGATVGSRAPAFDLAALDGTGGTDSSASLERQPLVVNFWSSTCSVCTSEMPALEQVQQAYPTQVRVVGVDVADPRSRAAAFARRLGVTYPLLADPDGSTAAAYDVTGLPVTFVIGPGGTILARHDGNLTAAELAAVLQMDFQQLPPP